MKKIWLQPCKCTSHHMLSFSVALMRYEQCWTKLVPNLASLSKCPEVDWCAVGPVRMCTTQRLSRVDNAAVCRKNAVSAHRQHYSIQLRQKCFLIVDICSKLIAGCEFYVRCKRFRTEYVVISKAQWNHTHGCAPSLEQVQGCWLYEWTLQVEN